MAQTGSLVAKDEFMNTSDGHVGVTVIGPHGEHKGVPVEPHGAVFLSEDEQILTANAPKDDKDNPFLPQPFEVYNDAGDVVDSGIRPLLVLVRKGSAVKNRRPLGVTADEIERPEANEQPEAVEPEPEPEPEPEVEVEETGATPTPEDEPEKGEAAPGEEVATPAAARRRRKTTA